eukprot:10346027-Lingulodinium_polyedra.AAC.1
MKPRVYRNPRHCPSGPAEHARRIRQDGPGIPAERGQPVEAQGAPEPEAPDPDEGTTELAELER